MVVDEEMKRKIDSMSYEEMLRKIRFNPIGDEYFVGFVGKYFNDSFLKKKKLKSPDELASISRKVGW